jgi:hypothetical protein
MNNKENLNVRDLASPNELKRYELQSKRLGVDLRDWIVDTLNKASVGMKTEVDKCQKLLDDIAEIEAEEERAAEERRRLRDAPKPTNQFNFSAGEEPS